MADYNDKAHVTMEPMTREMQIPKGTKMIGIVGDNESERVDIDIPRWYDGIDLGSKSIYIVVSNDNEQSDQIIPDIKKDADQLHLTWVVKSKHVSSEGTVYAHILATDTSGFRWQSLDGEYEVKTVNNGPENMPETQVTAVEQKLVEMDGAKLQAANAAGAAIAAATETAPPIISAAEGVASVTTDSADRPLRGLTVYGKTTQNGTPSEEAPVDPMGTGTASPLRIVTAGRNLAALTPRTENNNGITSSYDEQTSVVTVTGTATGTAYVSYWLREPIPAGVHVEIGLGNGSSDGNITLRVQSASANTTIATLDAANKTVNLKLRHAFEFLSIRVNAGATVNMNLQIGVTVRSASYGYEWTHPDDPTSAQIIIPGLHSAVGGLLQGVPAVSDGNYTDENGQQWIADTVEYDAQAGTAQIVRRVESVTFDGDAGENWVKDGSGSYFAIGRADKSSASHGLCTHYQGLAINAGENNVGFTAATDKEYIRFRPTGYADMTVDQWRARLTESPVTVLYALAEPVTTPITGDELAALAQLRSRYPATTIYNDAGAQMEARYVADTKKYVDDAENVTTSRLYGKTMYYDGDSIAYGSGSNGKGFGDLLAEKYNMVVDKFAVSGATLSVFESETRHNICTSVKRNMKKTYDYMLFDGGYNDYANSIQLGELSTDATVPFSAMPDETTICGALESIFQYVQRNYPRTKIYYLLTHKVYNYWTKGNQSRVYEFIKTVCDRYSVEIIDVFGKSGFCTYYDEHKTFTNNGDMVHPTEEGYNTFYLPLMERTMN